MTKILLLIIISNNLFSTYQFTYKNTKNKKTFNPYILTSQFTTYTPFFNLNYFTLTTKKHQKLLSITNTIPYFQLSIKNTNIDTYILIIKKSIHIDNISLYRYTHSTTPQIKTQKKQIKLFNQTINDTPYTTLSIPLSLTTDSILNHNIHNYPDNIINITNQTKFQTF